MDRELKLEKYIRDMNKDDFRELFEYFLNENSKEFQNRFINDLIKSKQPFYLEGLMDALFVNREYVLNSEFIRNTILSSLISIVDKSEISYEIDNYNKIPEFGSEEYSLYLSQRNDYSNKFESDFWMYEQHLQNLNLVGDFKGYLNVEITRGQIFNFELKQCNYIVDEWLKYIEDLIDLFFFSNIYNYKSINKDKKRIVFEVCFNKNEVKKSLKFGRLIQPSIQINLKYLDKGKYVNLITLPGENPYTMPSAVPIDVFISNMTQIKNGPGKYEIRKMFELIDLGNDLFLLENDASSINKIKKHLYYYFYLARFYCDSYLHYINTAVDNTLELQDISKS